MSFKKTLFALPVALVAALAMSSLATAQNSDCSAYSAAGCASGCGTGCNSGSGTGCGAGCGQAWPGGGCGNGCSGQLCSDIEAFKQHCALITERNDAWPLPFNCWDREAYHVILNQQYAHGLEIAHVLTPEHFDANTNELNRSGESHVAWIMQNAPISDKKIFVYEDQTGPTLDQRMSSVRNVVDRWYGHMGGVEIAKSRLAPNRIPASYQQLILEKVGAAQPAPIIPIASGDSLTSSVN